MDEAEQDVVAVCTRIIELTRVLNPQDVDTLIEELNVTLSEFEAEVEETTPDLAEPHIQEIEAVVRGLAQRDSDAVSQQVEDDIDAMQDIVDGMSDSE